jgi:hypothetical protein
MGGFFGGSHKEESASKNTQRNYNSTATSTPNIPDWWLERYKSADGALDGNGMTADQRTAADFLRNNLAGNPLAGAYGAAANVTDQALAGIGSGNDAIGAGLHYLQSNQDIGSNTLGHWFPDAVKSAGASADYAGAAGASAAGANAAGANSAGAPAVTAGTGAAYMGAYSTPLSNDYVDASLNDYDAGAAQGFNALRAQNASAFGNKRTGVAEGQFMADAARGRGTLSSNLRFNAFNTAADLGQTDASRALAADTTTAGNLLNNNQFNAGQAQSNNQFNAGQAQSNNQFNANLAQSNNQYNAGNLLNSNQFNANLAQNNNQYNSSMLDGRQKFDIGQADAGDDRRLGIARDTISAGATRAGVAGQAATVASQGFNNAVNFNNANVGNANALGNFSNMTLQQILALLNLGQAGIGSTKTEAGTDTGSEQSRGSQDEAHAGINFSFK